MVAAVRVGNPLVAHATAGIVVAQAEDERRAQGCGHVPCVAAEAEQVVRVVVAGRDVPDVPANLRGGVQLRDGVAQRVYRCVVVAPRAGDRREVAGRVALE